MQLIHNVADSHHQVTLTDEVYDRTSNTLTHIMPVVGEN